MKIFKGILKLSEYCLDKSTITKARYGMGPSQEVAGFSDSGVFSQCGLLNWGETKG